LLSESQFLAIWSPYPRFSRPKIVPIPKAPNSGSYRLIALYEEPEKIVIGQTAKYLRRQFDPFFLGCSYAFRWKDPQSGVVPNHHDAFLKMHTFVESAYREGAKVWVAECDISKFFDAISHAQVIYEYDSFVNLMPKASHPHKRARKLLKSYLASYSFNKYARSAALNELKAKKIDVTTDSVPWVDDDRSMLDYWKEPAPFINHEIGVPQGGALSCFIANLVLHRADLAVAKVLSADPHSIYLRYCDDMVILSRDKNLCSIAYKQYINELKALKLPFHEHKIRPDYNASYWDLKSRDCYELGRSPEAFPWTGFVGYQVRYDGKVRIRRKSIEKEILKQKEVISKIVERLRKSKTLQKKSPESILASARSRLTARAVGKGGRQLFNENARTDVCWVGGFKALKNVQVDSRWIRHLDRTKNEQIRILRSNMAEIRKKQASSHTRPKPPVKTSKGKGAHLEFYGKPFSYARILKNLSSTRNGSR
jgi:hypothetical protein